MWLGLALTLGFRWPRAAIWRGLPVSAAATVWLVVRLVVYWYLISLGVLLALRGIERTLADWWGTTLGVTGLDGAWYLPWEGQPFISPIIGVRGSEAVGWATAGWLGLALCVGVISPLARGKTIRAAVGRMLSVAVLMVTLQPIYVLAMLVVSLKSPTAPMSTVGFGIAGFITLASIWRTRAIRVRPMPLKA